MLADYETLVQNLVRDDANRLALQDIDDAIALALLRYSKDRPQTKVEDVTPTNTTTLPLPNAWEADFSALKSLEYPVGENPPEYIEPSRYSMYQDPTAITIKLIDAVDAARDVRAAFTIAHVLDATHDTIPLADREAAACWAGALLCDQLAAFYSGGADSTIQADSVRQQSKSQEYASRAKALRKRYLDELGVEEKTAVAASSVAVVTPTDSRGQARITHSSEYRRSRTYQ
ncbi:MAG: hypothetical protein M0015_02920 [Betaproteobacteria bacterium]|nr:hypothetical protein [Betaproteobacteria bacterium]